MHKALGSSLLHVHRDMVSKGVRLLKTQHRGYSPRDTTQPFHGSTGVSTPETLLVTAGRKRPTFSEIVVDIHETPHTLPSAMDVPTAVTDQLPAYDMTLGDVRETCPEVYSPSEAQVHWVGGYVVSRPHATIGEVAALTGVNVSTAKSWHCQQWVRTWIRQAIYRARGAAVGEAWDVVVAKMRKGSLPAAKMILEHNDPDYMRQAPSKQPSTPSVTPSRSDIAAAQASLRGDGWGSMEDQPASTTEPPVDDSSKGRVGE